MLRYVKNFTLISFLLILSCSGQEQQKIPEKPPLNNISKNHTEHLKNLSIEGYEKIKNENKGKVIIANFYASWCPPCREEIPGFVRSYVKFRNNLLIMGLSLDVKNETAINFINEMGINYPVYKADETLQRRFNIMTIPTSVIYKADGTLYNVHFGYLGENEIEKLISMLK